MRLVNSMRSWDIFCKVIDNYGDMGVCWRLAADLASRAHRVRLWVDDLAALSWMAPGPELVPLKTMALAAAMVRPSTTRLPTSSMLPLKVDVKGLVLLEAFRQGRPVIASRAGGPVDIVADGVDGWLFTPGDPDALAELLRRLTVDDLAAAGRVARETYLARYTPEVFRRRIGSLIDAELAR